MKYNQVFYNYEGIFRYLKLAKAIRSSLPAPATKFLDVMGEKAKENSQWRKLGLLTDDMITEENDIVQEALKRLPDDILHARYARYKVALHTNLLRRKLPEDQWVKSENVFTFCNYRTFTI
jgi:hypothetical protein